MHDLLSSADSFSKPTVLKNSFRNTVRVLNSLDPGQARQNVGPGLGPNCLQKFSADKTSRQIVCCLHIIVFFAIFLFVESVYDCI